MAEPASPPLDTYSRRWVLFAAAVCLLPLLLQLPLRLGGTIALSALGVAVLSWQRPVNGFTRLVIALALIATVLILSRFAIGRDTGCALLAAMLAVKPAETFRLRDARSLLGFALFAPFATFLLDQGPLTLALGLSSALFTLATLQRLAEIESKDAVHVPPLRRMAGIGRLLVIGLPIALAAFWLFPRLSTPMWGVPERALARTGLSDRMSPGEWIDLMSDDTPALRARFFGATPRPDQLYWRGPVLWNFDGRTWTRPRWRDNLPQPSVERSASPWDYELELEPDDSRRLIALDLPIAAPAGATLAPDHELQAQQPQTRVTRWRMRSAPPARYQASLPLPLRQLALALPQGYNPRTLALARQWRQEAGAMGDAKILARAIDWIHRDFAYTLDAPLAGRNSVDEFLFDQKAGFCEHFSSAFVVLMRAAGIPARVVTGYAGGYRNPIGDYWLVRRSDAHAWAEVWLSGRGWVRVDPTAAVAPDRVYDTLADRQSGAFAGARSLMDINDWVRRGWNDFVLGFDANRQRQLLRPLGIERIDDRTLILMLSAAVALALLWMVWVTRRDERERDPVLRAWHRLSRRYRRLGLEREVHEPAGCWVDRVGRSLPGGAPELRELSQRFTQWRYADSEPGGRSTRDLTRALRAHRPPATSPSR